MTRRDRLRLMASALALAAVAPGAALAHMPYLLPNMFDAGKRDHVTVEASFAEDAFVPEVVMQSAPFHVQGPRGDAPITSVVNLRDLAVFEAALPSDGTYRISSGERLGRRSKMYKGPTGQWLMGGEGGGAPPKDATMVEVQSVTVADVYVTRGAPSKEALATTGKGLELRTGAHPNELFAAQPVEFRLTFDGRPLEGATVDLFRSAGVYDGKKAAGQGKTDAAGKVALTPPDAGTYLALIRYRTTSPAKAETPYRSYSYTLAFEATE
jgi:uncharacterized GH25 family protein